MTRAQGKQQKRTSTATEQVTLPTNIQSDMLLLEKNISPSNFYTNPHSDNRQLTTSELKGSGSLLYVFADIQHQIEQMLEHGGTPEEVFESMNTIYGNDAAFTFLRLLAASIVRTAEAK
jgi:hypothetical protein